MSRPWDRQRNGKGLEPNLWYSRFVEFLRLGPRRSVLELYNQYIQDRDGEGATRRTSTPSSWGRAAVEWNWRERAEAWDEAERQRQAREFKEQQDRAKIERIALLRKTKARLAQVLDTVDIERATLADLTRLLRAVCQEERAEYDDEPTQRVETTDTIVVVGGIDLDHDI